MAVTEVTGPIVRMCTAACYGVNACRYVDRSRDLMGLADRVRPGMGDDEICAHFAYQLALSGASDSNGVLHMIPDGCEFIVHKNRDPVHGQNVYVAVYSGTAPKDGVLAGVPEWDAETARNRVQRMRVAREREQWR